MSIMDNFKPLDEPVEDPIPEVTTKVRGKIHLIDESGYGFIISRAVPFRRLFFHWTFLENDTLTFDKLEEGMIVEFKPVDIPDLVENGVTIRKRGWRAIKIKVLPGEDKE